MLFVCISLRLTLNVDECRMLPFLGTLTVAGLLMKIRDLGGSMINAVWGDHMLGTPQIATLSNVTRYAIGGHLRLWVFSFPSILYIIYINIHT